MPHTLSAQLGSLIVIFICALALGLGERREKLGAIIFLAAWLLSLAVSHEARFFGQLFAIDVACLIGFISLCWKAPNSWPLWAAASQCLTVVSYQGLFRHIDPSVFLTLEVGSGYGVMLALLIGTLASIHARAKMKRTSAAREIG